MGVLKNFLNFIGKHLCWSLASNFIKKRLQHRFFPVKFFRTLFFTEHLRRLLLTRVSSIVFMNFCNTRLFLFQRMVYFPWTNIFFLGYLIVWYHVSYIIADRFLLLFFFFFSWCQYFNSVLVRFPNRVNGLLIIF